MRSSRAFDNALNLVSDALDIINLNELIGDKSVSMSGEDANKVRDLISKAFSCWSSRADTDSNAGGEHE